MKCQQNNRICSNNDNYASRQNIHNFSIHFNLGQARTQVHVHTHKHQTRYTNVLIEINKNCDK